jgi:preprotein translocase subunit SecG
MNILRFALMFVHYFSCVVLIILVVQQASNSNIIGGSSMFGGGGETGQIFNAPSRTAFVNKLTIFVGFTFLLTSFLLAKFYVNIISIIE